jgi:hypothetical protein
MADAWQFLDLRKIYYVGHDRPGEMMVFHLFCTFLDHSQINTHKERKTYIHTIGVFRTDTEVC